LRHADCWASAEPAVVFAGILQAPTDRFRVIRAAGKIAMVFAGSSFFGGHMLQIFAKEVHLRTRANLLPPWIAAIGLAIVVGIAYFFAARLSLALLAKPDGVALFWPAAGVSSGVLIALGRDARLPIAIGVVAATIMANLMGDRNVWSATSFAFCNAGESLLIAWLIERYFGWGFSLGRLRHVLGLLAATVIGTAASGIAGVVAYKLFHSPTAPIWSIWQHWFVSDAFGVITVAPLVIGLAEALRHPPARHEMLEGIAALVTLAVTTIIVVSLPPEPWETVLPIAVLFPILLWITARSQPVFAAAAAFTVSLTIVWTITFAISHFGDRGLPIEVALCAYVLAALFAERRQHEAVLEESEARLQEALTAGAVTAFEWDPRSGLSQRSENAAQILGFDPGQPFSAAQFLARVRPDDRTRYKGIIGGIRVESPSYSATFRFLRSDGREVWLEETAKAEFDSARRFVRLKGLTRDITRRKQAEKRQDLLITELDHRVKNVLARVAAVVMHTRRRCETMDEFVKALHGRIQSMAAAHSLLSQSRWSDVGLTDLIRHQLAPYTTDANITISGPEVMLTSAQTQAVAMVIHELVTNAAKHGALSWPDGRVSVSWDRTGTDAAAILTITWRELGGAPMNAPVRSGYGSTLIRNLIPHELGGTVDLTFPRDGACCKIEIPLEGSAKTVQEDALRSAIMEYDAVGTGVRKFFKKLRVTAQREIEKAVRDADVKRKLASTILPTRAVVTVGGIDLKFEFDGDIELS
jgi:PAS domain S-box-containing protein